MALVGCGSATSSQLARRAAPADAAAAAVAAYDKDGDGALGSEELEAAPGLAAGAVRIDADRNGALTREEILARFEQLDAGADLIGISVTVFGPRGPLPHANVTLSLEPYQGEGLQSYVGVTDQSGTCYPAGSEAQLPGVPPGYYVAHVVDKATGVDATLGREIASDASGNRVELRIPARGR
jgi:hypothetical protein